MRGKRIKLQFNSLFASIFFSVDLAAAVVVAYFVFSFLHKHYCLFLIPHAYIWFDSRSPFVSIGSGDPLCWNGTFIMFSCFVLCAIIVQRRYQLNEITDSNMKYMSIVGFLSLWYCIKCYTTLIQPAQNCTMCIYRNGMFICNKMYKNRMLCGWKIRIIIIMAFN